MFEAFKWMFKNEDFWKQVFYLIRVSVFAILLAAAIIAGGFFIKDSYPIVYILSIIATIVILALIPLFYQGYFWELTMSITERKTDTSAPNIYKKWSIKEIVTVELPELSTKKFVWRGISSIVATILLIYPIAILFGISLFSMKTGFNLNIETMIATYGFAFLFISFFIPALLWNYAVRDSVIAVWNLPKAIHIIGCYTVKYLWNVALLLFVCVAHNFFLIIVSKVLEQAAMTNDFMNLAALIIYGIIYYAVYVYMIFVNAYLIGTVAPPSET